MWNGTIINASYPRSGHRFLRNILISYFDDEFIFYESHQKVLHGGTKGKTRVEDANYIKTHDFELRGSAELLELFPSKRLYVVQIRHPLEAIASYYEFSLRHQHIRLDTQKEWDEFLDHRLNYWKSFYQRWITEPNIRNTRIIILYEDLYQSTFDQARQVIEFISGESCNGEVLRKSLQKLDFTQYIGDSNSKKKKKRDLHQFPYFDEHSFREIERKLKEMYLLPIGIPLLFEHN